MVNPRLHVPGPTFSPAPFGLLSVATVVDDGDPHWRNGIEWEALCSGPAAATVAPCTEVLDELGDPVEADPPAKTGDRGVPAAEGMGGFTLYAVHLCSAVGRTTDADRTRAGMLLTNGESRGLEAVVRSGVTEAGVLPGSLQDAATTVGIGLGGTITEAIAALELELSRSYGGSGVIHLSADLATYAGQEGLLVRNGARLETLLGTRVAVGGDPLVAPGGAATTLGWAYATGAVVVYRGPVVILDGMDRAVNDSLVIAERSYAVGWDCLAAAAAVIIPTEPEA